MNWLFSGLSSVGWAGLESSLGLSVQRKVGGLMLIVKQFVIMELYLLLSFFDGLLRAVSSWAVCRAMSILSL
jgi:hypothetical protein